MLAASDAAKEAAVASAAGTDEAATIAVAFASTVDGAMAGLRCMAPNVTTLTTTAATTPNTTISAARLGVSSSSEYMAGVLCKNLPYCKVWR